MRPWLILTLLLVSGEAGAQSLQESVKNVWVHDVPAPPEGDFWDPVTRNLFSMLSNPATVYPDVVICARALRGGTPHCSSVCWDLKGDSHGNGQPSTECRRPLHVQLLPNDPRMLLEVLEMDGPGAHPHVHAIIARNIAVSDPASCPHDRPCRLSLAKGALVLSFGTEVQGVVGTAPAAAATTPVTRSAPGGSAPAAGTPDWQRAVDGAKTAIRRVGKSNDPTKSATSREIAERAAAATQDRINWCLRALAHGDEAFRSRMPACANTSGKEFESCMYTRVFSEDPNTLSKAYGCSRQFQGEVDTLGKTSLYVVLKSQICGIGQWIGLKVCQD